MSRSTDGTNAPIDPFHDPVSFLATFGIEAELVEVCAPTADAA